MANVGVDFWGVYITLTEAETKILETADDTVAAAAAVVAAASGAAKVVPVAVISGLIGVYVKLNKQLVIDVDGGYGVTLTLPWIAIYAGQYWIIVPSGNSAPNPNIAVIVRSSTGNDFGPGPQANQNWTGGRCYGSRGTFFADVTGDGKRDCILVNNDTITVRRSTGGGFGPNEDWTHGPCYGALGTFFADVTGDGKADCILVNNDTITVRRSTGGDFGPNEDWTHGPCHGALGTFFADVTGDGKADCILVNHDTICVRRSTGSDFGPGIQANEDWSHGACYGALGTFFADATGDGKADCILVNPDTTCVRRSTGSDFGPGMQANEDWTHGACYGRRGTFFADVTGDGRADCILVNPDTICVRRSTGIDFGPGMQANEDWTHGACYGNLGTFFADVNGDGKADAIIVNG
jgi:hypothetical protein